MLSPTKGQVAYALLTRSPLRKFNIKHSRFFFEACVACFEGRSKNFRKRKFLPLLSNVLNALCWTFSVRLACVRHAASVRPEPGSNSPIKFIEEPIWLLLLKEINLTWSRALKALDPHIRFLIGYCSVFKVHGLAMLALFQCRIASTCI